MSFYVPVFLHASDWGLFVCICAYFFTVCLTCLWSHIIWHACFAGSSQCSFLPAMLQTGSVTTSSSEKKSIEMLAGLVHWFTCAWIAWVNLSKRGGIFRGLAWLFWSTNTQTHKRTLWLIHWIGLRTDSVKFVSRPYQSFFAEWRFPEFLGI